MTRRGLLGLAGAAAIPARKEPGELPEMVWHVQACRGCGRVVCFLPRQRRNRCAWCRTVARKLRAC